MRGDHCDVSQTMSLPVCIAAQGCLCAVSTMSPFEAGGVDAPTEQHDYGIALGWDEAEQEDVLRAAVVAFGCRLA